MRIFHIARHQFEAGPVVAKPAFVCVGFQSGTASKPLAPRAGKVNTGYGATAELANYYRFLMDNCILIQVPVFYKHIYQGIKNNITIIRYLYR